MFCSCLLDSTCIEDELLICGLGAGEDPASDPDLTDSSGIAKASLLVGLPSEGPEDLFRQRKKYCVNFVLTLRLICNVKDTFSQSQLLPGGQRYLPSAIG